MAEVLIVDDSATMRLALKTALKQAGHVVHEACDGVEALNKLNEGLKVKAIITDLNMPNMDGVTFIQTVRKLPGFKFVPILMLTTESSMEKKEEGRKVGASGWIVKPFSPEQLLAVLKKLGV
ncbi:two-component system, chemotaxis family, response regulator CheY [Caldanaerovirga acetigignens]|uniref:Stage 0 sporulation protein A homolog n=1 Tax=Caldanaerovirga acetigignens TaxID=447595 RepID=A0A1M7JVA6_9FIRM|nr:two-component system, chemotaxis family, response regulator CheY [Caldanaerovirga acetigignens]